MNSSMLLFFSTLILPLAAPAAPPSFDCAKADGEVETLICSDAALAALDGKLDATYKAAAAQAEGALATRLREDQRGWLKGRDECWKATATTWITASWTVDTVRACVDAQYRLRISELQALWRLLPPETVAFACNGNPVNELITNFFASDPPTIRIERGDRTATLWKVGAAADGLYEGQNVSVMRRGADLEVSWLDVDSGQIDELQCTPR